MYNCTYGVHARVHTHFRQRVLVLGASHFKVMYLDPKWFTSAMGYVFKKWLESSVVYGK